MNIIITITFNYFYVIFTLLFILLTEILFKLIMNSIYRRHYFCKYNKLNKYVRLNKCIVSQILRSIFSAMFVVKIRKSVEIHAAFHSLVNETE